MLVAPDDEVEEVGQKVLLYCSVILTALNPLNDLNTSW